MKACWQLWTIFCCSSELGSFSNYSSRLVRQGTVQHCRTVGLQDSLSHLSCASFPLAAVSSSLQISLPGPSLPSNRQVSTGRLDSHTYPEAPVDPGRIHSHSTNDWTVRGRVCSRHLESRGAKIRILDIQERISLVYEWKSNGETKLQCKHLGVDLIVLMDVISNLSDQWQVQSA